MSCTRIERMREVSATWPACSFRLTIPHTCAVGSEGGWVGGEVRVKVRVKVGVRGAEAEGGGAAEVGGRGGG